jgi:anti-sigma B factor antagonist
MDLEINTREARGGRLLVRLTGTLDTTTSPELATVLGKTLHEDASALIFDLGELEYISSAGLIVILRAKKLMAGRGGNVFVLNPQPRVEKVFAIVKAMPKEAVFTSWERLDAHLDAIQKRIVEGE